jgi:hypothetical protein
VTEEAMKDEIQLEIATPNGLFIGAFPKTAKVSEVIEVVVREKHLQSGDAFELIYNGNSLQPVQRPLVSFGLDGVVKLELVATGSGVAHDHCS